MLDILTPWLPVIVGVAAAVAIIVAVGRGILALYRSAKGRTVKRRTVKIIDTVTPLLDERFQIVDTAILNLRLELGETKQVVDEVKAIVSDGLQTDVAEIRKAQLHVTERIDGIYNHLIGDD